jgi:ankyrin repeat protein
MLSNIIRFFDKSFTDQDSVITAIRSNKINQLKSLLEKKADVDAKNREGVRPLQAAFDSRNITIFKVLIEYKADINFQYGRYSRTLLDIALDHDCRSYAQLLLEKQASVDIKNEHGRIPLHYAAQNGYINEVELLIETANLDYRDKKDDTALHLALRNNRPKVAVLLINKKGTSINLADGEGLFPLHKAVQKGDDNIVNLLLDKKADIEALTTTTTPRTSLMLAAEQDKSPMIKLLIQSKANTEFKNKDGKNAILYAAEKNHLDSVKTLLEWNAAIPGDEITKLKDNNCKTYLQLLQNGLEFSERVGKLLWLKTKTITIFRRRLW